MMFGRKVMAGAAAAGMVLTGTSAAAGAQPVQDQDGLVNVAIGDVTVLQDVNIGVAAQIAAEICDVNVGPVAVLGRAVDRSGGSRTVCQSDQGPISFDQN